MEYINEELTFLKDVMKAIVNQFGEKCEVALHDLTKEYNHTIVSIENGHITNRKVGDCGSNLGLEVLRGTEKNGNKYNYITQTKDGKTLRSSSVYIRNKEGKVIGSLCINLDISDFILAENTIKTLTMNQGNTEVEEVFTQDVSELLEHLIHKCQQEIGKPVQYMNREDKKIAIKFLDEKGAFLITKAGKKICEFLDISKFTLYNYLEETRK